MTNNQETTALEQAPEHIKLAVDLIYLLESNEIEIDTAIEALNIVLQDLKQKKGQ